MSCNCERDSKAQYNTWGCGCQKMNPEPKRARVAFCDICDPCVPGKNLVKFCAYVVPTLEEGRYYRNSFVFVEDEQAAYYVSDDRSEIPFGTRPIFNDDFDPASVNYKKTVVYDMKNKKQYVFGPDGSYMTFEGV